jgi:hypothetical protein
VASGAPLLVDVEFGRGRRLFALSQGDWDSEFPGDPALPNTGALLRVNRNGTFTVIEDGLDRPSSLEFIGNTAYVVTLTGEIRRIDGVSRPTISISNAAVVEGERAVFVVALSEPSTHPVKVDYATVGGTAFSGSDYRPRTGTLTFKPGETRKVIRVRTIEDSAYEQAERFSVKFSNAVGAAIADDLGDGTIDNDDLPRRPQQRGRPGRPPRS